MVGYRQPPLHKETYKKTTLQEIVRKMYGRIGGDPMEVKDWKPPDATSYNASPRPESAVPDYKKVDARAYKKSTRPHNTKAAEAKVIDVSRLLSGLLAHRDGQGGWLTKRGEQLDATEKKDRRQIVKEVEEAREAGVAVIAQTLLDSSDGVCFYTLSRLTV